MRGGCKRGVRGGCEGWVLGMGVRSGCEGWCEECVRGVGVCEGLL